MTREELFDSFPEKKGSMAPLFGIILFAAIMFISYRIHISTNDPYGILFAGSAVGLILLCSGVNSALSSRNSLDHVFEVSEWKRTTFKKYTDLHEKIKIPVHSYAFSLEGVRIMLETDKPKKLVITNKIEYVETNRPFVEAVWVEGFEEVSVRDGFYSATLFLRKSNN